MRYSQIRSLDISNGEGVGVALFVQGCNLRCKNCFNSETWDFNGGKEWTEEVKNKFMELINKPYITRVSILGGEPLAYKNVNDVLNIVNEIRISYPDKKIWLYTGYTIEEIIMPMYINTPMSNEEITRIKILSSIDILVDGKFIYDQRDMNLHFRGSKNQRVIDVSKTSEQKKIILYCE